MRVPARVCTAAAHANGEPCSQRCAKEGGERERGEGEKKREENSLACLHVDGDGRFPTPSPSLFSLASFRLLASAIADLTSVVTLSLSLSRFTKEKGRESVASHREKRHTIFTALSLSLSFCSAVSLLCVCVCVCVCVCTVCCVRGSPHA